MDAWKQERLAKELYAAVSPDSVQVQTEGPGKPVFITIDGKTNVGLEIPASCADTITAENIITMIEQHRSMGRPETFHVVPKPELRRLTSPEIATAADTSISTASVRSL